MSNAERRPGFEHVCVIQGLHLGDVPVAQFERELGEMLGVRVQYLETVHTLPDRDPAGLPVPETGGRSDVLFAYHRDDYSPGFNAARLARGIRWFEDAISPRNNPNGIIYPERVRDYVDSKVWMLLGAPPVTYPSHTWLGSMQLDKALVIRDLEATPIEVELNCVAGRWHAWVRRSTGGAPVALLLVHENSLERAREDIDAFFGQHAVAMASIVRSSSGAELMVLMPAVHMLMAGLDSSTRELVKLAHRNEPDFVERWNHGPVIVLVHPRGVRAEPPSDPTSGAGALGASAVWGRTTSLDGWCVVGVDNDDNLCEVVRINLSGEDRHNYLVDRKTAELVAQSSDIAAPATDVVARKYSAKERYAVGDVIAHPTFGTGRVVEVMPDKKVTALFDVGAKILVHSR